MIAFRRALRYGKVVKKIGTTFSLSKLEITKIMVGNY